MQRDGIVSLYFYKLYAYFHDLLKRLTDPEWNIDRSPAPC